LAGCATSQAATQTRPKTLSPGAAMTPGMIMPDGSTMGAAAPSASKAAQEKPSDSAAMVCAAETRSAIKTILVIKQVPAGTATYADHLFTCTYKLAMGPLILSVKESPDRPSTDSYYTALRQAFSNTENVDGLGEAAWGTKDGTVVLRKDNDVLRVDATGLPAEFGAQHSKRNDFAYEIASNILGCWTGDE
ncbi:MAG: hypothetical protein ABI775_13220, partial [Pseudonocardiales bacterium]